MKIGDKIICIKDFYNEEKHIFNESKYYSVTDIEIYKQYTLVKVEEFYFAIEPVSDLHFGKYFQTIADYRETRISQILES